MDRELLDEVEKQRQRIAGIPFTGSERLGESVTDYLRGKRPEPELKLTVDEYINAKIMQKMRY